MNRQNLFPIRLLVAALACCALSVFARDPQSVALHATMIPLIQPHINSLTPPPKEWAMFPQDDPPPQANNSGQAPANGAQTANGNSSAGGNSSGGIVSAANLHSQAPQRELPLLWMVLTGALSLGAVVACGGLILQKDAPEELAENASADDLPVVSEELEVNA